MIEKVVFVNMCMISDNKGKTALDIATEKNDESLVKFLLKYD